MGLLTEIILLPLAPVRGVGWLAKQLEEEARRQQAQQERNIEGALQDLDRRRAAGELSDEEAAALEEELIEGLLRSQNDQEPDE